jgi:hypothetical protein
MNDGPPSEDRPDDIDALYRRAASLDASRPSEAVRRAVLDHAGRLAAERLAETAAAAENPGVAAGFPRRHAPSGRHSGRDASATWRRPALFGGLAAAVLAGLLITPHFLGSRLPIPTVAAPPEPKAPAPSAEAAAPAERAFLPGPAAPNARVARQQGIAAPASGELDERGTPAFMPPKAHSSGQPGDPPLRLRQAAAAGDVARARELLALPVDLEGRDVQGRTALFLAAQQGRTDMVQILLAHGADANAADAGGITPLGAALAGGHAKVASALRRAGAQR